jgi:hypothetical protein
MNDNHDKKPCPFCGKVPTDVKENTHWTGLKSQLISVDINHHCFSVLDTVFDRVHIKVRGRTIEDAWRVWNRRFK